jgi:hypothetical protein
MNRRMRINDCKDCGLRHLGLGGSLRGGSAGSDQINRNALRVGGSS